MLRLLIIGAGGHGQVVADAALAMARTGGSLHVVGFLDDNPQLWNRTVLGLPILGATRTAPACPFDAIIVAIGDNARRKQLYTHWLQQGATFATLVHPSAVVAQDVELGSGNVLCAGVIVNTGSRIGCNVILNTGCTVDHHNRIGNHAHVAPGAHLGGDVEVAEGALIGIGAIVLPQRQIAEWASVGAGAVVTRPVGPHQTVVGIPACPLAHPSREHVPVRYELLGGTS
jgi:sugar O-acyltransferase (sialic acid O-acetyltransferase NeuD family)